MKVYRSLKELPLIRNAIVTQGTFDGVHLAHQAILDRLKELAKIHQGETVVMTFEPHPRMVLFPEDHGLHLLQTLDEKIASLEHAGVDHLLVLPFTKEFSRLTSLQFIRDIIVNTIQTKVLVIGYNHRFGKNREGTFEHLKEYSSLYGFEIEEIPRQDVEAESVSSTRIRKALELGEVQTAAKYLGRFYTLSGIVTEGKKFGRTIGFPTANIAVLHPFKLVPADGVYAVKVLVDDMLYGGMLNAGFRPTVDGTKHSVEVHIFEFSQSIYEKNITIMYVDKIRDEKRFSGPDELKKQLEKDKLQATSLLANAIY
ncbi:MAG: bifunctional riboflavin kinase/FAD synthetase [Bacteroidota bacterium]|jgi:riboflavin kinase/FMN adenylyltransferase|nr:bifunctional riboflavin kinase/FAD synthetase [Sphingobacteriales bacterium]